jgi:hypothetical protein
MISLHGDGPSFYDCTALYRDTLLPSIGVRHVRDPDRREPPGDLLTQVDSRIARILESVEALAMQLTVVRARMMARRVGAFLLEPGAG